MRKLLNNPWFVGLAALGALLLVVHAVFPGAQSAVGNLGADIPAEQGDAATGDATGVAADTTAKILSVPTQVRDPFAVRAKAETVVETPAPDLVDTVHLSAVWTQDGQTLVLINNRICQGGEELGRLKVESTTPDGVWLSHWNGRDFLAIGGSFTLNTPAKKNLSAAASL